VFGAKRRLYSRITGNRTKMFRDYEMSNEIQNHIRKELEWSRKRG
jgi:chemotaxis methyl-accepting protein methylase